MSHCLRWVPNPTPGAVVATTACFVPRVFAAVSASAIIAPASLMARLTPDWTRGSPANRSRPRTSTSAAKMTTSASAICCAVKGSAPAAPWVSTTISWPAASALCSSDSAAM